MPRTPRRLALLLVAACVLVALTAGVAIGAAGRNGDRSTVAADDSFRVTDAPAWPASWIPHLRRTSDDDVVTVNGRRCPRSHPRKVGSSTSSRATSVDGGPVRRQTSHRSICAR